MEEEEESGNLCPRRVEIAIAAGRLLLAVSLLLGFVLDAGETDAHTLWVRRLAFAYSAYATGVTLLIWAFRIPASGIPAATYVVDLLFFSVFLHLAEDPVGPFLTYYIFMVISGAIRWQVRGALITGIAGLGALIGVTLGNVSFGSSVQWDRFIMRCAQFVVVAALLASLSDYHKRRWEFARLAELPTRPPSSRPEIVARDVLAHAADVLRTREMVLVWHDQDEPSLHVVSQDGDRFNWSAVPLEVFDSLVAEPLRRSSFLCTDVSSSSCAVLLQVPGGFRVWHGAPLSSSFRERYAIKTVLAVRIATSVVNGWLFALNRAGLSVDDFLVGRVAGRLVGAALDQQSQSARLRDAAVGQERLRLARELHDGLLQTLTGLALQAGRLRKVIARNPVQAESVLGELEETILTEQRALRSVVDELKTGDTIEGTEPDCAGRLREVATRVATQWDVRVHLELAQDAPPLPRRLAREICRIAQESLVNAIRHGAAKDVRLQWGGGPDRVNLRVAYAGRGFATFKGRHDLESLNRMKAGPLSLKHRVSELRGALIINSDDDGASVDIAIPLTSGTVSNETRGDG
jgi:signal transduction histidine kinase